MVYSQEDQVELNGDSVDCSELGDGMPGADIRPTAPQMALIRTKSVLSGSVRRDQHLRFHNGEGTCCDAEYGICIILAQVLLRLSMGETMLGGHLQSLWAWGAAQEAQMCRDRCADNRSGRGDGSTAISHLTRLLERTEDLGDLSLFMVTDYIDSFIGSVVGTLSTIVHGGTEQGDMTLTGRVRYSHTAVAAVGVNGPTRHSGDTPKKGESST